MIVGKLMGWCALLILATAHHSSAQHRGLVVDSPSGENALDLHHEAGLFHFSSRMDGLKLLPGDSMKLILNLPVEGSMKEGPPGSAALPAYSFLLEGYPEGPLDMDVLHLDSLIIDLDSLAPGWDVEAMHAPRRKGRGEARQLAGQVPEVPDSWLGGPVLELSYEGRMRGMDISRLHFRPLQYHPVARQLKYYYALDARFSLEKAGGVAPSHSKAFQASFARILRQERGPVAKAIQSEEPMGLLILGDSSFRESLQPLVQWKTRKGFRVTELYRGVDGTGSSREELRSRLEAHYKDPPEGHAPHSYLLIVGDVQHIPTSQASGEITDLYYATYDGPGDYIPDCYYGRISVENEAQLEAVLEKVLEYEQYQFPDPSFLDRAMLIAGVDYDFAGTYGNGHIHYAHEHYLKEIQGLETALFYHPGSGARSDEIRELFSGGMGFVNYTGHGLSDQWQSPYLHKNHLPALQNQSAYPLVIGNGCETNYFVRDECFAEAMIRTRGGGALAYIGCTNDSYWDEDYYWAVGAGPVSPQPGYAETGLGYFDRVFHLHGEDREVWTPSLGEMIFGGNLAVMQSSSERKKFYWEIYQLAGDPSLTPWFGQPLPQQVEHGDRLLAGQEVLTLRCAPWSYAALSLDGALLDAAHASAEGYVSLDLPDTLSEGELDLVVSSERHQPYFAKLSTGAIQEAHALVNLMDPASGEDEPLDFLSPQQNGHFALRLSNGGMATLERDTFLLSSFHPGVQVLDSALVVEGLAPGDSLVLDPVFAFRTRARWEDGEEVLFVLSNRNGPLLTRRMEVHAPRLITRGLSWDDRPGGNGNGIAEPGEVLRLFWTLENRGHAASGDLGLDVLTMEKAASVPVLWTLNTEALLPGGRRRLVLGIQLPSDPLPSVRSLRLEAGNERSHVAQELHIPLERYVEDFNGPVGGAYPLVQDSLRPWIRDSLVFHSGPGAFRSAPTGHLESSSFSLALECVQADTLHFRYRVSSEAFYDFLVLEVDGKAIRYWSGEQDWSSFALPLDSGMHRITWRYEKDRNTRGGRDAAWIDDILFPASARLHAGVALMDIEEPSTGPWLGAEEYLKLKLRNASDLPQDHLLLRMRLAGQPWDSLRLGTSLAAGEEAMVTPPVSYDLSSFTRHFLEVELLPTAPGYRGNKYLWKEVERYAYPDLALDLESMESGPAFFSARVRLENKGNLELMVPELSLSLEGEERVRVKVDSLLQPGEGLELELSFPLETAGLAEGWNTYRIAHDLADSLEMNNMLSGRFYHALLAVPEQHGGWELYPNPARESVRLSLQAHAPKDVLVKIFGTEGRVVGSWALPAGSREMRLDLKGLSPGMYYLRMESGGEAEEKTLIIHP